MAKRPKRKSAPVYTEIFAKVESYNVPLAASLNHDAFAPQHALGDGEKSKGQVGAGHGFNAATMVMI